MIPGFEKDRTLDTDEVSPDQMIERHIKLAHRCELVLLALKRAGLPFSRFTWEALVMATECFEAEMDAAEPEED